MPTDDLWVTALSTWSSTREKILEHRFIADVTAELWARGIFDFAVSHSEVDNSGYDLILEARGVTRHVQLKAMHLRSSTAEFPVQARLEEKPSACVVLMIHDLRTLAIAEYRWFGAAPGAPLPSLGNSIGRQSKPNMQGIRTERPAIRRLAKRRLEPVTGVPMLVDRLFGGAEQMLGSAPVTP
ncbi:hypothetical protein HNP52_001105 [Sphingomonas kyeonggiensis]|uniref:DUF4365 domain-containing protein n=1 Tax=Sphingomonas kyeonggiensis TaxID=1268553 RepID=A0A7W7NRX5_9SPHN|nr:hypothetical protein [Sphingomonas kyeonggiensis]MBB4838054.1 hypothetical protein [Sphingomonas kyeonggiensis]